jgi:hypothetical protein
MNWNEVLKFLISATAITVAIIYVAKRIVDKSLDLALEKYKSTLAVELETHKITFGKLHQDRLDAIKLFHRSLYDLEHVIRQLTTIEQGEEWTRDQKREELAKQKLDELKNSRT